MTAYKRRPHEGSAAEAGQPASTVLPSTPGAQNVRAVAAGLLVGLIAYVYLRSTGGA